MGVFVSRITVPTFRKVIKSAINIDISRYSNQLFWATTGLILSKKVSLGSVSLVEADWIEQPLILFLASKY